MFRLLSDLEAALNELLVSCRESVDHFCDGAQLVTDEKIALELQKLATEREPFITLLEGKIRESGDLPSMPDPDKEDSEMLLHHLRAAVSDDYTKKLLQQRIDAEKNILGIIERASSNDDEGRCKNLLSELAANVNVTINRLGALM